MEPRARHNERGDRTTIEIRGPCEASAQQSGRRAAHAARANAAPFAKRHDHAEQSALHDHPQWHAGYRSRTAQARHPWLGEAATNVHNRVPVALSDGVADGVRRMRRQ